jgi:acyl-CoA synthetase (AMP-forming)/AMP-acid ligase II
MSRVTRGVNLGGGALSRRGIFSLVERLPLTAAALARTASAGLKRPDRAVAAVSDLSFAAWTLLRTGIVGLERPDRAFRASLALQRWGATLAGGYAAYAVLTPERIAIQDERGPVTFAEADASTNDIARGLREAGVREDDNVAVLACNHRGFIEAVVALSKLGANAVCMNTGLAGRQIAGLCARERIRALIHDSEFSATIDDAEASVERFLTSPEHDRARETHPTLADLARGHLGESLSPPCASGRVVILTSGTTGSPKGAPRRSPDTTTSFAPILAEIPLRARSTTLIAAPLFHAWGFGHLGLSLLLGSSVVLRSRFDPEQTLADVQRHRAQTLVLVPVMLSRILELEPERIARYDTSSLRAIALSGSALPGDLALRAMDTFGDIVYNLYGSTEVAWASIARPEDLRAAPATAGRPPRGTVVRLYDQSGVEVRRGTVGRIFVGNELTFEGYTGGDTRPTIDGLMATGDLGYFDSAGRLFIAGRDDDMIVSGGENVYPQEVEDLLATHPAVKDVAVIGVEDEKFGQRLRAFVVVVDTLVVTDHELREYVRERLARFKVPREVVFVDELPRNATGKVLKRKLPRS